MNLFGFFTRGESISAEDLKEAISGDVQYIIIDVRTPEEFKSGSIESKNTVNVQMDEVYQFILDNAPEGDVYLLCASGGRSASVQKMLALQGIEAINVQGGMLSWEKS